MKKERVTIPVPEVVSMKTVCPMRSRPTCAYCGTPMRPEVRSAYVPLGYYPQLGELIEAVGKYQHTVKGIVRIKMAHPYGGGQPTWDIDFWTGDYQGYMWVNGVPLFCKTPCAMHFAQAAFRAGYRMEKPHG